MRLLVKGDVIPDLEMLNELNIKYDYTDNGIIIYLPEKCLICENNEHKHLKELKTSFDYCDMLSDYCTSDDMSLACFVVKNHKIIASGNITKDENNDDLYICDSNLRAYGKDAFTIYDVILAGQNSIEDLSYFYEKMLAFGSVSKNK